jgi:hypothetical protein
MPPPLAAAASIVDLPGSFTLDPIMHARVLADLCRMKLPESGSCMRLAAQ